MAVLLGGTGHALGQNPAPLELNAAAGAALANRLWTGSPILLTGQLVNRDAKRFEAEMAAGWEAERRLARQEGRIPSLESVAVAAVAEQPLPESPRWDACMRMELWRAVGEPCAEWQDPECAYELVFSAEDLDQRMNSVLKPFSGLTAVSRTPVSVSALLSPADSALLQPGQYWLVITFDTTQATAPGVWKGVLSDACSFALQDVTQDAERAFQLRDLINFHMISNDFLAVRSAALELSALDATFGGGEPYYLAAFASDQLGDDVAALDQYREFVDVAAGLSTVFDQAALSRAEQRIALLEANLEN